MTIKKMTNEACAMRGRILTLAMILLTTTSTSAGVAGEVEFLQVPNGGI